ncbi:hypothetical protein JRQ81_016044, partial [Phrynocephalus forsythii]
FQLKYQISSLLDCSPIHTSQNSLPGWIDNISHGVSVVAGLNRELGELEKTLEVMKIPG